MDCEELVKRVINSQDQVILFVGAGISLDPPSNIPSSQDLKVTILKALYSNKIYPNRLDELIEEIEIYPLEGLFEWMYNSVQDLALDPLTFLLLAKPNINHIFIAHLVKKKIINTIITTNFDTLLEDVFRKVIGKTKFKVFYDERRYKLTDKPAIYKLHGSAENLKSIRTTLSHTYKLPSKIYSTFRYMIENYPVIFIGYSGNDFDISNLLLEYEYLESKPRELYAIVKPGSTKNQFPRLFKKIGGTIIRTTIQEFNKYLKEKVGIGQVSIDDEKNHSSKIIDEISNWGRNLQPFIRYLILGAINKRLAHPLEAVEFYKRALQELNEMNELPQRFVGKKSQDKAFLDIRFAALFNIAEAARETNNFEEAAQFAKQALKTAYSLRKELSPIDILNIALTERLMGLILHHPYYSKRDFLESKKYLNSALKKGEKLQSYAILPYAGLDIIRLVKSELAILERQQGNLEQAIDYMNTSLNISREIGPLPKVIEDLHILGNMMNASKKWSTAERLYLEALKLLKERIPNLAREASIREDYGKMLLKITEKERALSELKEAVDIYRKIGDNSSAKRLQKIINSY